MKPTFLAIALLTVSVPAHAQLGGLGGVLKKAASRIAKLGKFSSVHIVSSPRVWRAAGKQRSAYASETGGRRH